MAGLARRLTSHAYVPMVLIFCREVPFVASKKSVAPAPAKKAAPAKAPAKKAAPAKAPAKKAVPAKAPAKAVPAPKAAAPAPAKKTPAKAPAKKVAGEKKAADRAPARFRVKEDESPWTSAELKGVRIQLGEEITRLQQQIAVAEADIADLIRDSGDGAGDDQADAGSKTYEREQEMSIVANDRDLLLQAERALARIGDGTYGVCESCGNAIGKLRLQAFPKATMCITCKEREDRR